MKIGKIALIVSTVLLLMFSAVTISHSEPADKPLTSRTFIDVAKKCLPSVVSIRVKKTMEPLVQLKKNDNRQDDEEGEEQAPNGDNLEDFFKKYFMPFPDFQKEYEYSAAGSGVIIKSDGYIITNNHVISEVKEGKIEVKLNDDKIFDGDKVKIIGIDSLTDLAVIKVEATDLPAAEWGDSDKLEIGEWVVALGNPLELNNSVTQGIVSAKGREIHRAPLEDFIQTTAIINPGNSGGPLVNLDGQVIGINTAIASVTGYWQGIGFAIPSNVAKRVIDSLINEGKVKRGYIGIVMDSLREDVAKLFNRKVDTGVIVSSVNKDTPAEKAGLKAGDVIVEVDGIQIKDPQSMVKAIATKEVGTEVNVKALRYVSGEIKELSFKLKLIERPAQDDLDKSISKQEPSKQDFSTLGLKLEDITKPDGTKGPGVKVRAIKSGSPAAKSNLRPGDVIFELNNLEINSVADFESAISKGDASKGYFIQFDRNNTRFFTVIVPEKTDDKDKK